MLTAAVLCTVDDETLTQTVSIDLVQISTAGVKGMPSLPFLDTSFFYDSSFLT